MTDSEIIALYWRRDESAIAATDAAYGGYCYCVAERILSSREDSEECVNDTWYRTWESIPPQKPNCLRAFLAKITRHLALDRYRLGMAQKRGGGEVALALDELAECVPAKGSPEESLLAGELEALINRFLASLPERERSVFLRRYFYVEPLKDIAGRYGLSLSNAKAILSRTRRKLRAFLKQEGYGL